MIPFASLLSASGGNCPSALPGSAACDVYKSFELLNDVTAVETLTSHDEDGDADDTRCQVAGNTFVHAVVARSDVHDCQVTVGVLQSPR